MPILPEEIYRFNTMPVKILMAFFIETEHTILKFVKTHKTPQTAGAVWRKRTKLVASHITTTRRAIQDGAGLQTDRRKQTRGAARSTPSLHGQLTYHSGYRMGRGQFLQ